MSSNAVELRSVAAPARIGQATAVEQSRAVAEVQAAVIVAQQMPRDIDRAEREMRRSCSRKALAERAFYRYKRGGSQVSGESIVLAKELARCWGNIDYGLAELRRDDLAGESEMMAFAWDLETNTRPRTTFIVPHVRSGTGARLTDPREVYENNTNMGNRRMREMILNLMPPWFIDDAKDLCHATMANDTTDGRTIAERAAKAVERFGKIGVRPEQLAQKLGAPQGAWSATDLARLTVIYKSIERNETTVEDEFGAASGLITAADLAPPQNVPPAQAATPSAESATAPPAGAGGTTRSPQKASTGQVGLIQRQFERLHMGDGEQRDARLRVVSRLAGRLVTSSKDLTPDEARKVKDTLESLPDGEWTEDSLLGELAMADDPRDGEGSGDE